jgi:hypothetical protein
MSQAFWVIQPRRNNPVIQLEKAVLHNIYLSAEAAKEALEALRSESWEDTMLSGHNFDNYEVIGLVADWPPSQFDKKPEVKSVSLEDLIKDLWSEVTAPEPEPETPTEPEWLPALQDISSLAKKWDQETAEAIGLIFLGTALGTYEGKFKLSVALGDVVFTISPEKSADSAGTAQVILKGV